MEAFMSDPQQALRDHLLYALRESGAHATFDETIADFPAALRGKRADGFPHTAWMLLEHLRLAQWDILEFSRNGKHISPKFPDGYWAQEPAPPSAAAWDESVKKFQKDLQAMQDLVASPKTDLYAKLPWGDGQTVLREAILLIDHNAYHVGQLVMLRKTLGAWEG
jgi:hypothetical protein